jgi:hypothetical protein
LLTIGRPQVGQAGDRLWHVASAVAEAIDEEVAQLLKRTGMISMAYAPESGSETTRQLIQRTKPFLFGERPPIEEHYDDIAEYWGKRLKGLKARFAGDPRGASGFLVADFDFDEICILDAGSWFHAAFRGERVPTFEEALAH